MTWSLTHDFPPSSCSRSLAIISARLLEYNSIIYLNYFLLIFSFATFRGASTSICILSNAMQSKGFALSTLANEPGAVSRADSDGISTSIGELNLTFARMCKEYFSKSGIDLVLPLKLGRNIDILGPRSLGSFGNRRSHTFFLSSITDTASAHLSLYFTRHHPRFELFPSFEASLNSTARDGSPHVRIPCTRAASLLTYTLVAHAQEVGAFHTSPPSTTTSSSFPQGESS